MAELKVELRTIPCGPSAKRKLFITIDGRQALHEGPRAVGYCNLCKSQCLGASVDCEARVFGESVNGQNRCPHCHMVGKHHVKCQSPRK